MAHPSRTRSRLRRTRSASLVCHQLPARSFHLWMPSLPVCARCTGIYLGAAIAPPSSRSSARFVSPRAGTRSWCCCRARADGGHAGVRVDDRRDAVALVRALAGVPLGVAAAWAIGMVNYGPMSSARAATVEEAAGRRLVLLCLAAWAIPGVGHIWLGRRAKAHLPDRAAADVRVGLALQGRLFPFDFIRHRSPASSRRAAGIGILYFLVAAASGSARAMSARHYEYGNTLSDRRRPAESARRHRRVRRRARKEVMQQPSAADGAVRVFRLAGFCGPREGRAPRAGATRRSHVRRLHASPAWSVGWLMFPFPLR